jgi:hypothetical protein
VTHIVVIGMNISNGETCSLEGLETKTDEGTTTWRFWFLVGLGSCLATNLGQTLMYEERASVFLFVCGIKRSSPKNKHFTSSKPLGLELSRPVCELYKTRRGYFSRNL